MLTRIRERNEEERKKKRVCIVKSRQELSSWDLVARGSDGRYMTTVGSLGFFKEGGQTASRLPNDGRPQSDWLGDKKKVILSTL